MATDENGHTFEVPLTVRFHEADRAGVAFFGRAFEYIHTAQEEVLAAAGCPIRANFDAGWGLPIAHAEADYRRPLVLGDKLVVAVSVHAVGTSSITFDFQIRGAGDPRDVRVTARLVQVCVSTLGDRDGGFLKRELPAELLAGLRRLRLLDHLG